VTMSVRGKSGRRKLQDKRAKPPQSQVTPTSRIDQFFHIYSGRIVALLCIYAGLRIFIFAAVFPLFNPVDEQAHLLSIRMYARGQWPGRELPEVDKDSAKLFAVFGTLEYLVP
jgi:hypothetical protein